MNPLLILVLIVWAVSGVGLIVFVLLHSGKGTGVSDMIASSLYSTQTGTNIIEKNLDRITIIFAIVFMLSLLALMLLSLRARFLARFRNFFKLGLAQFREFRIIPIRCLQYARTTSEWWNGRHASLRC